MSLWHYNPSGAWEEIRNKFLLSSAFPNIVCKMWAILFRPRCIGPHLRMAQPQCHDLSETSRARFNIKTVFLGMGIPMLKIRRSQDHLIFNMGMPILVRQHLYIEMAPRTQWNHWGFFDQSQCSLATGCGINAISHWLGAYTGSCHRRLGCHQSGWSLSGHQNILYCLGS